MLLSTFAMTLTEHHDFFATGFTLSARVGSGNEYISVSLPQRWFKGLIGPGSSLLLILISR